MRFRPAWLALFLLFAVLIGGCTVTNSRVFEQLDQIAAKLELDEASGLLVQDRYGQSPQGLALPPTVVFVRELGAPPRPDVENQLVADGFEDTGAGIWRKQDDPNHYFVVRLRELEVPGFELADGTFVDLPTSDGLVVSVTYD